MTLAALSTRDNSDPDESAGKNIDNKPLSGQRRPARERGTVENKEFAAFARRIVRAYARRVAQGDIEALADLVALRDNIEGAINDAVIGLREFGYSWTDVASRLGISKQAARQRWGMPGNPTITDGGHALPCTGTLLPFFDQYGENR